MAYDNVLVTQPLAQKNRWFFLIESNFPADELNGKKIKAIAESVKVIEKKVSQ